MYSSSYYYSSSYPLYNSNGSFQGANNFGQNYGASTWPAPANFVTSIPQITTIYSPQIYGAFSHPAQTFAASTTLLSSPSNFVGTAYPSPPTCYQQLTFAPPIYPQSILLPPGSIMPALNSSLGGVSLKGNIVFWKGGDEISYSAPILPTLTSRSELQPQQPQLQQQQQQHPEQPPPPQERVSGPSGRSIKGILRGPLPTIRHK